MLSRFKFSLRKRVKDVVERYNNVNSTRPEDAKYYLPENQLTIKEPVGRDIQRLRLYASLTGKMDCDYLSEINQVLTELGSDFRVTNEYYSELH